MSLVEIEEGDSVVATVRFSYINGELKIDEIEEPDRYVPKHGGYERCRLIEMDGKLKAFVERDDALKEDRYVEGGD